jgi:thymidine phosphorylase
MLPQQIIATKRDGAALALEHITSFVSGLVSGAWGEGQVAALAMAIVLKGMSRAETVALTAAMTHSGRVLNWREQGFDGPVLDKHSTGGVGDKVSLILAPLVAACGANAGVIVPMISGRGLGHTGGTLDKLEALSGYNVNPAPEQMRLALREAGCAIVGASADVAPADRRLYAIRDITATVESVPLITASILSKKLAAGLSALVLDVKVGSGATMAKPTQAQELAQTLVAVAQGAGLPARALLTSMDGVLGHSAGNALEVQEALDFLSGSRREPGLLEVTLALAAELLHLGGVAGSVLAARAAAQQALDDGRAAEHFARMVAALGGPIDVWRASGLQPAPVVLDVKAAHSGWLQQLDVRALGQVVVALGGGRVAAGAAIDQRVGLDAVAQPGAVVQAGDVLARVHAADAASAAAAAVAVQAAFSVGDKAPTAASARIIKVLQP